MYCFWRGVRRGGGDCRGDGGRGKSKCGSVQYIACKYCIIMPKWRRAGIARLRREYMTRSRHRNNVRHAISGSQYVAGLHAERWHRVSEEADYQALLVPKSRRHQLNN